MNKKISRFFKAYWVIIWLIIASIALVSFSAYAAYMRTQNAKRVISTLGGAGNRFSSNRMDELETNDSPFVFRVIPVPRDSVTDAGISKPLTVCNYPQGMESTYYTYNIYYDLVVELTDNETLPPVFENEAIALSQYYIVDEADTIHYFEKDTDSGKYLLTISGEMLKGNKASDKTYTLHFPTVDTGIYMKSFAEPKIQNGLSMSKPEDLRSLGAMISIGSIDRSQDTNWTGALIEPRASGKTIADYDAFNYVISGAGAGTITLKWKSSMLDMIEYYKENDQITATASGPDNDGYMTLQFDVTASQTKNRYSFQMYKAKNSDWSTINSFAQIANDNNAGNPLITFNFRAATENQQNQG